MPALQAPTGQGVLTGVRAVLFDLDGVLIQSYEVWFHLLNHTAATFGAPAVSRETFASCWGQGVAADVRRFFPDRSVGETEAHYHAHFMAFREHLHVEPDAGPVVRALRAAGRPLAVITNTPAPLAREILTHAELPIETVVGGTDVPRGKPEPDMVIEACRRLVVAPACALVVGDSEYDTGAAAAAGVPFAGFRRPGDVRIDSLGELLTLLDLG